MNMLEDIALFVNGLVKVGSLRLYFDTAKFMNYKTL